ncbi:unnamed protein product [Peniophora sp. CBMAI 1063]|nr:unnamed protein product [Peniophora sp. CBMAI 1063]
MNNISNKFAGDEAPDLTSAEFRARKAIVQQVEKWCDDHANEPKARIYKNQWSPILYKYEIVKTSAKTERDWGHLLFTDMTLSYFMLVMTFPQACNCGNLSHHDYGALTRYHADRFMSLLVYLHEEWDWGPNPRWVRATYVTPAEGLRLAPDFLDNIGAQTPGEDLKDGRPPIYVATADSFSPSLFPNELEKIDNTVARGSTTKNRKGAGVRERVLGSKEDRPDVSAALRGKNMRQCGFCQEAKELSELRLCAG